MIKKRPKYLALFQIRLPLPGVVSILHRISGALLFFPGVLLLLLMLHYSLHSIETYTRLVELLSHPIARLAVIGLLWAFLHHFCAGIRFLAIDVRIGSSLAGARLGSKWVLAVSLALTILLGVLLW